MTSASELTRQILKANCLNDPQSWSAYEGQGRWIPFQHLQVLSRDLYELVYGDVDRLLVVMPPRHGKSELCSVRFPVWYLARHPGNHVMMVGYGTDFAKRWGRRVRDQIMAHSAVLRLQVKAETRKAHDWELKSGGGMLSAGVGGSVTGRGANLLICDDPVKGHKEAASAYMRDEIWEWWGANVMTRLHRGAKVLVIQTRWHEDDLAGRLLKEMEAGGEQWRVRHFPALAVPEIPDWRNEGEALCPELFTQDILERKRREIGLYKFSCLYQGIPIHAPGQFWDPNLFNDTIWVDAMPSDIRYLVVVNDPSMGRDQKRSDFNAMVAIGTQDANIFYITSILERTGSMGSVMNLARLCARLPRLPDVIAVESIAFQELVCDLMQRELPRVMPCHPPIVPWERGNDASKEYRIQALDPLVQNRQLRLVRNSDNVELLDQFRNYGDRTSHDDGPDAVEMGMQLLASLMTDTLRLEQPIHATGMFSEYQYEKSKV